MIAPSLVFLLAAVPAFCVEPAPSADLAALRAAAKANFLAHAQGDPTVDSAARLPAAGDADGAGTARAARDSRFRSRGACRNR